MVLVGSGIVVVGMFTLYWEHHCHNEVDRSVCSRSLLGVEFGERGGEREIGSVVYCCCFGERAPVEVDGILHAMFCC